MEKLQQETQLVLCMKRERDEEYTEEEKQYIRQGFVKKVKRDGGPELPLDCWVNVLEFCSGKTKATVMRLNIEMYTRIPWKFVMRNVPYDINQECLTVFKGNVDVDGEWDETECYRALDPHYERMFNHIPPLVSKIYVNHCYEFTRRMILQQFPEGDLEIGFPWTHPQDKQFAMVYGLLFKVEKDSKTSISLRKLTFRFERHWIHEHFTMAGEVTPRLIDGNFVLNEQIDLQFCVNLEELSFVSRQHQHLWISSFLFGRIPSTVKSLTLECLSLHNIDKHLDPLQITRLTLKNCIGFENVLPLFQNAVITNRVPHKEYTVQLSLDCWVKVLSFCNRETKASMMRLNSDFYSSIPWEYVLRNVSMSIPYEARFGCNCPAIDNVHADNCHIGGAPYDWSFVPRNCTNLKMNALARWTPSFLKECPVRSAVFTVYWDTRPKEYVLGKDEENDTFKAREGDNALSELRQLTFNFESYQGKYIDGNYLDAFDTQREFACLLYLNNLKNLENLSFHSYAYNYLSFDGFLRDRIPGGVRRLELQCFSLKGIENFVDPLQIRKLVLVECIDFKEVLPLFKNARIKVFSRDWDVCEKHVWGLDEEADEEESERLTEGYDDWLWSVADRSYGGEVEEVDLENVHDPVDGDVSKEIEKQVAITTKRVIEEEIEEESEFEDDEQERE